MTFHEISFIYYRNRGKGENVEVGKKRDAKPAGREGADLADAPRVQAWHGIGKKRARTLLHARYITKIKSSVNVK